MSEASTTPTARSVRIGWIDASAGVAGDMLLGALLHAGADPEVVRRAIGAVDESLDLRVEETSRHSIGAYKVTVLDRRTGAAADDVGPHRDHDHDHAHAHDHDHDHDHGDHSAHRHGDGQVESLDADRSTEHDHEHGDNHRHGDAEQHSHSHRGWREVRQLLDAADLDPAVRTASHQVFAALAKAEGHVHAMDPEEVGFHEVGALDAIGDVVGCAAAINDLGIDTLYASVVTVGSGEQTLGAHGRIPIPGPAVLHLARQGSIPLIGGPVAMEMTTPTGAAMLTAWVSGYGAMPAMVPGRTGVGAGTRDPAALANVCRVVLGTRAASQSVARSTPNPASHSVPHSASHSVPHSASHSVPHSVPHSAPESTQNRVGIGGDERIVLECNVDDLDPRIWPVVLQHLLELGADDVWLTPILMKKGRPAHTLSVLARAELCEALALAVLTQTTTLGVRVREVSRFVAERRFLTIDVDGVQIAVKQSLIAGEVVNSQPEFADVAAAAAQLERPVKDVLARAIAAAQQL